MNLDVGYFIGCDVGHTYPRDRMVNVAANRASERPVEDRSGRRHMQIRNEGDDVRAFRSQLGLCQRLAEEVDDPKLAVRLRSIAEKLKAQATLQHAA